MGLGDSHSIVGVYKKNHLSHSHFKDGGFIMGMYPLGPCFNNTFFRRVGQCLKALFRDLVTSEGKAEILRSHA